MEMPLLTLRNSSSSDGGGEKSSSLECDLLLLDFLGERLLLWEGRRLYPDRFRGRDVTGLGILP